MAKKLKLKGKPEYCWLIAYINSEYIDRVHSDLAKHKILWEVEAYIPTVKVLSKKFKGEEIYQKIPLLFNYGFFKIPKEKATQPLFLEFMKDRVSCLISFVKNPDKAITSTQIKVNRKLPTRVDQFAVATEEEIANLLSIQDQLSIHSADDINKLYPGQIVTLKGYPFDDMDAEILEVKSNHCMVKLLSGELLKKVKVSFDNIFYTVYKHDDSQIANNSVSIDQLSPEVLQQIYNISINFDPL